MKVIYRGMDAVLTEELEVEVLVEDVEVDVEVFVVDCKELTISINSFRGKGLL